VNIRSLLVQNAVVDCRIIWKRKNSLKKVRIASWTTLPKALLSRVYAEAASVAYLPQGMPFVLSVQKVLSSSGRATRRWTMYFPIRRSLPARPEPDNTFWTASTDKQLLVRRYRPDERLCRHLPADLRAGSLFNTKYEQRAINQTINLGITWLK